MKIAGRYLVSGAQLGELIALCRLDSKRCNEKINYLIEKQFLGNSSNTIMDDVVKFSKMFKK